MLPPETVSKKISALYLDKRKADIDAKNNFFTLQSLPSLHLIAPDNNSSALQTVRIFLIVAILILCIACINYVNLSTARSMLRSKEVSMRKIIGAARAQLFVQFIIESLLLFVFASLLSLVIIYLLLPLYNQISGRQLLFSFSNSGVLVVVASAIIGSLALSGIYPALQLSSFKPIEALRGKLSLGIKKATFRKVLVVTQFVFSVGLIISTIVISRQLQYMREKDLGFDKEHVFVFGLRNELHDHFHAVRNELLKQPWHTGCCLHIRYHCRNKWHHRRHILGWKRKRQDIFDTYQRDRQGFYSIDENENCPGNQFHRFTSRLRSFYIK
jgi:putative ABC transport system permease protein